MTLEKFSGSPTIKVNPTVLVYGWYHQGNLGDDLFVEAFKRIFPSFNFVFTDKIKNHHLQDVDVVFFGGGSFLGEPLKTSRALDFELLKQKSIMYIGVGAETDIHPDHQRLLPLAKLIALRSYAGYDNLKRLNDNIMVITDLVYSLHSPLAISKIPNSILFIPNIAVVPKWNDPHWQHAAWDYFKIEMAQLLDSFIDNDYTVKFLPYCINGKLNDCYAAAEIINRMKGIEKNSILDKPANLQSAIDLMSKHRIIITQRYHGMILADMARTPCLTIAHHDKLKDSSRSHLSYYGCSKNLLMKEINDLLTGKVSSVLPIDRNIFTELRQRVEHALCRSEK
jgi:polysaccharide pyruvyl transferase WcaK-like protein